MQKREVEKVKTFLDFEEFLKDFEQALVELETPDEDKPDHFMMWIEPWTDEQFDDFANMVWDSAEEICHTLIGNNLKYNSAYWWLRKACKERYGDDSIPYFVHSFEKTLRTQTPGDNENSELDKVGYELLEYVCRRLEEMWAGKNDPDVPSSRFTTDENQNTPTVDPDQPLDNPEMLDLLMQMDSAVSEFGEKPEIPDFLIEKIPVRSRSPTCLQCGKKLTGKRRLFCSRKHQLAFDNEARRKAKRVASAEARCCKDGE